MANAICIVGPSKRFLSGISYYTIRLANEAAKRTPTSVVVVRNLVPRFLFPGRRRVGASISSLEFSSSVSVSPPLDWYLFPNIVSVRAFLTEKLPEVVVFQWWTAALGHTYLVLLWLLRRLPRQPKLVLTFHETQDPLEQSFFLLRIYASFVGPYIFRQFDSYVVHSQSDARIVQEKFRLPRNRIFVVPHGSYDNFRGDAPSALHREDPDICSLLFFGLIRPYKGVDHLIDAFDSIPPDQIGRFRLTIAGEPWDYDVPKKKIAASPYRERIRYIDRYIRDDEVDALFKDADVAVFPYTRASQSGAAHVAVSYGIPVVVSAVGGLSESMAAYQGTIFVEPENTGQLTDALLRACAMKDQRFPDPHPWSKTIEAYELAFGT